jgi:hypothetical protein
MEATMTKREEEQTAGWIAYQVGRPREEQKGKWRKAGWDAAKKRMEEWNAKNLSQKGV